MYSRFVKRVKDNLHIVLAFSPVGEVFRNRLRMFPSLVNCCTIDWFSEWPDEALLEVARAQLARIDRELVSDEDKEKVFKLCVYIHQSVRDISKRYYSEEGRYNYVTPTSYLELLSTLETLLGEQSKKIVADRKRLQTGLHILQETEKDIVLLK
jgi:dynein heavy chain, axonemal